MASKRSDRYDHTLVACGHVRDAPSGLSTFRDNCRNNCFPCFASKKGNTHNEYSQPLLGKQGYKAIPNQVAVGEISCTSGLSPCGSTKRASESLLAANALSIEECRRKLGVRCRNGLPLLFFAAKSLLRLTRTLRERQRSESNILIKAQLLSLRRCDNSVGKKR